MGVGHILSPPINCKACLGFFLLVTLHRTNFKGVNLLAKIWHVCKFDFCLSLFTAQILKGSTFSQKLVALAVPIFYTFRRAWAQPNFFPGKGEEESAGFRKIGVRGVCRLQKNWGEGTRLPPKKLNLVNFIDFVFFR